MSALNESIQHWERILSGDDLDYSARKCALCSLHWSRGNCNTCLLITESNPKGCMPVWHQFNYHCKQSHRQNKENTVNRRQVPNCPTCQSLAQDVINLLKESIT